MFTLPFWVMLAFAVTDWVASWRGWHNLRWLTKPVTMILLIAWFTQMSGWRGSLVWFGVGLVFSLLGDVVLQAPGRFFLLGVGAFFLAHLAYIVGFLQNIQTPDWRMAIPVLLVGIAFWLLNGRIRQGLLQQGESALVVPVMAYALVLSLMWLAALSTLFRPGWTEPPAALVSLGAGLFFLSDSVLAYNRFVRALPASDLVVMVTYHLGQILIAGGALGQFAGLI